MCMCTLVMGVNPTPCHKIIFIQTYFTISIKVTLFSFSDSDYGKKKKKGGKKKPKATSYFGRKAVTWGKGKKRKQEVSSEDSDDYRPKKKNKKNKIKKSAFDIDAKNIVATSGRRTRGVKIDYSMIEGSDDSDEPKKEEEGPKGKGKGPRKWDGTDDEFTLEESDKEKVEEEEEEEEESELSEVSEEDLPLNSRKKEVPKKAKRKSNRSSDSEEESEEESSDEGPKKSKGKGKAKKKDSESEESEEESEDESAPPKKMSFGKPKSAAKPDISDESEEEEEEDEDDEDEEARVQPKVVPAVQQQPARVHPSSKASPFPKAPPPDENEEDSDDGFQSPATPSEDEED